VQQHKPTPITSLAKQTLHIITTSGNETTGLEHSRFGVTVSSQSDYQIQILVSQTRGVQLSLLILPPSSHASDSQSISNLPKKVEHQQFSPFHRYATQTHIQLTQNSTIIVTRQRDAPIHCSGSCPQPPSGGSRPEAAAHYSSGNKNAPYSGQVATIKFCDDKQTNKEND
jgi:hypothetical protein